MLTKRHNAPVNSLISILMPVKNEEAYLEECLNSIINQSVKDWELVVVNDHSTDSTDDILREYIAKDARIRVFKNVGHGIIPALKLAFQESRGEYITRMDGDDVMLPNKLEILRSTLLENGEGYLSVGGVRYFSEGKVGNGYLQYERWLNNLTFTGLNFSEIYKECVIPSPSWMLSCTDFEKCGGFNSDQYPEDYDLCFRMYKSGLKVIPSNEVVHLWRDYPERSSRNLPEYSDNSFLQMKLDHFLNIDYDEAKELVLWGAGKKGKKMTALLKEMNISFRWICNNQRKVGKEILGVLMEPVEILKNNTPKQVIILVANKDEQIEIRTQFSKVSEQTELFFFC